MTRTSGRAAPEGFTLVELLIVLTIIGLMSAAVVMAMPDAGGSLRSEAERFAARTRAAHDRALIEGRAVAVKIDTDGYAFVQRKGAEWRPLDGLMGGRWEDGTAAVEPQSRIVFDPTGAAEPARLVLKRDEDQADVEIGADGTIRVIL